MNRSSKLFIILFFMIILPGLMQNACTDPLVGDDDDDKDDDGEDDDDLFDDDQADDDESMSETCKRVCEGIDNCGFASETGVTDTADCLEFCAAWITSFGDCLQEAETCSELAGCLGI